MTERCKKLKAVRLSLCLLLVLMTLSFSFANNVETEAYQGTSLEENNVYENSNVMSDSSLELQETSAENNEAQIGIKQVTFQEKKAIILNKVSIMWGLIGGLFVIVFDIAKGVMYLIEMYFMFLILFKMFPAMLVKVKDSLTKWYLERI